MDRIGIEVKIMAVELLGTESTVVPDTDLGWMKGETDPAKSCCKPVPQRTTQEPWDDFQETLEVLEQRSLQRQANPQNMPWS